MAKLTLSTITSGYNAVDALNDNFAAIEAAVENTLSRDGTTPNSMGANFDMNGYRVINLPNAINNAEAVPLQQVNNIINSASSGLIAQLTERQIATAAQTLFTLASFTYFQGANNLSVYVNGVRQSVGFDYTETSTSSITFTSPLTVGDEVVFVKGEATTNAIDSELRASLGDTAAALPSIESYAALRAVSGPITAYYVTGVSAPLDGGAGVFRVDASDTTSADNGGTILVDAINRRWKREFSGAINLRWFGAQGAGLVDESANIQAALDSGAAAVYCPAGTYNISGVTIPSTVKEFFGDGVATKFVGVGAPAAFVPFMNFNELSGFHAYGFAIDVVPATYPENHALYFGTCQKGVVENIRVIGGGYIGVYAPACSNVSFKDIHIDTFSVMGILADTSPDRIRIERVSTHAAGSSHSIQIIGGSRHKITGCSVFKAGVFCINLFGCSDSIIAGNETRTDTIEGINVQDCEKVSIIGNTVYCLSGHADFGISLYGSTADVNHCLVEGNRVYFSGKSGIALASSATKACKQNHVVGNLVVSPNQLNEAMGAGVLLYGSTLCSENTIQANRLIDEGSTAKYGVNEWNDGGGNPQSNYIIDNPVLTAGGLVRQNNILTTTSQVWDVAKESFTPTITATSGTITTASGSGAYRRRGKLVEITLAVSITTNGTGAGAVVVSTPLTAFANGALTGRENAISGHQLSGIVASTNFQLRKYDNSYPGADGASMQLAGVVELA